MTKNRNNSLALKPDNSHLQNFMNERTTKLAEVSISHMIWHSKYAYKRLPLNLSKTHYLFRIENEIPTVGSLLFIECVIKSSPRKRENDNQ